MSAGEVCTCELTGHPSKRPQGMSGDGCGRYSANQEVGGLCSSCATGWHQACDKPRELFGTCQTCGWHMGDHGR